MRSYLLFLLWCLVEVHCQPAPYVTFMGNAVPNHGYVNISQVGDDDSGSDSVQCHTDLMTCCSGTEGSHRGDWHFPDGTTKLPFSGDIHENRDAQRVDLRRENNANSPVGIYRCDIATISSSVREKVYVGLYTGPTGGSITISGDLTYDSDQLTLTCISTGGPATTVSWTRDSVNITGEQNVTVLNDAGTARYTHTLTLTGNQPGLYKCTVSNNKPSSASASITLQVALPPSGVTASQSGPTSIRVTWTPPDPLDGVTGYRIHYTTGGGSSGNVSVDGGSTDNYTLTGLTNGETYTISIVATSNTLTSETVTANMAVGLIPGEPSASSDSTTATSISLSWSVPSGSVVDEYLIQWERDTSGACPDPHTDSTTISDGSATGHTIPGLEEDSTYTITVTASNGAGSSEVSNTVTAMTGEAAPSVAPSNVAVTDVTSTTITVQWGSVPCVHQNGVITGYSVRYGSEAVNVTGDSSGGTYTIPDLMPSTNYPIQVAAMNGAGTGDYSAAVNQLTKVAVPVLTVGVTAATSISVSWSSGGSEGVSYEVEWMRDTSGACPDSHTDSTTISDGSTSYTITGLQEHSTYTINMTASNSIGNERSDPVTGMTVMAAPSAPPSSVSATVENSTSITVQWGEVPCPDQNGVITGYSVQYGVMGSGNTQTLPVDGAATTETTITDLTPSTTYSISVAGVNDQLIGVYSSAVNELTEVAVPELTVGATEATSISVSWSSGGSEGVSYEVEWTRDTSGVCPDPHTDSATISDGSTSYTITGLQEHSTYSINMTASNSNGNERSDPITGMTMMAAPTAPPMSVTTPSSSSSTITVQWGEVPCIHQNGVITAYSIQYEVEGSGDTPLTMAVDGADTTEATIGDLMSSTDYSIQVAAVNSEGTGVYSDPINATTKEVLLLEVSSTNTTTVTITWTLATETTASSYNISYTNTNCFNITDSITGVNGSQTAYTLTGLEEGAEYSITLTTSVVVEGSAGDTLTEEQTMEEEQIIEDSVLAVTNITAPSAPPTDVRVLVNSLTTITVQWGEVPCMHQNGEITGYSVQYEAVGSSEPQSEMVSGDSSGGTATISGLTRQTMYTVQVAAVNSAGTGEYSVSLPFETPDNVFLSLNGVVIPNNGIVDIGDIGSENDDALLCNTNRPPPTGGPNHSGGDWNAPDGIRITNIPGFTRNRSPMVVRLKRTESGTPEDGIYQCLIKDGTGMVTTVNVGLYNSGGGVVTLSGGMNFTLNLDPTEFTLTCISTGGPATTVSWTRNNVTQGNGNNMLADGVTGEATNTLLVTGGVEGLYKCTVENEVSSQSSAELNVKAPSPPANVGVDQNGLKSVLVTWAPSEGPTITGYTVTYQILDGGEKKSVMAADTATNRTITELISGATYSISIVASSNTLPSTATTATITIEPATITVTSSSSTVLVGDSVTLTCNFTPPPEVTDTPVYEWSGPGVTDSKKEGNTLTLTNISTSDAGSYLCTVTLGGSVSSDTTITVEVPVPTPSIMNSSPTLVAGTNTNLTCYYILEPPLSVEATVTWTVNGVDLTTSDNSGISVEGTYLRFSPLTTSDTGTYTCTLSLTTNEPFVTFGASETSEASEILVPIPAPGVSVSPSRSGPLYAGTSLGITCTVTLDGGVDNSENVSIIWSGPQTGRHTSTPTVIESDSSRVYSFNLTISPLAVGDNGTVTCTATITGVDQRQSATSTNSTSLIVQELPAPEVIISGPTRGVAGEELQLTCAVTTIEHLALSAEVTVKWSGPGLTDTAVREGITSAIDTTTTMRTLTFDPLKTSHGAQYNCSASINIPQISVVKDNSNSTNVLVQIPRPEVTVTAREETVMSGSNLSVTCSIQPPPVDTPTSIHSNWTTPCNRHDVSNAVNDTAPQLTVSDAVTADSGDYMCSVRVTDATNSPYVLDSAPVSNTTEVTVKLRVTVMSDYTPAPGEAPGELGDNEFTAGSLLTLKCLVTGNSSEGLIYTWSVSGNPSTTDCTNNGCNIDTSSTANTLNVGGPLLYSYYAGDYTCRVEEAGRTGSGNSDVFSVSVVGAGIYALAAERSGPIANNGLIVSRNDDLRVECVSKGAVGTITTSGGAILTPDTATSTLSVTNPSMRPGVLCLRSVAAGGTTSHNLTHGDQGIYTCNIPDDNGNVISLNFGLYPPEFDDAPGMEPLTYHEDNRTLTCVSTGSPATTVSWMKDGNNITIDGNHYSFSQTIIDRASSTYRNVLTVGADAPRGVAGVYNCTVTNVLGSNSTGVVAVGISITGLEGPLTVGQPAQISCMTNIAVSSITWSNDMMHTLETSKSSDNLKVLNYTIPLVTDNLHEKVFTCTAVAEDATYTETVAVRVKVPANSLTVTSEISQLGSLEAGSSGLTLTCTVNETILGLANMPSAQWMKDSRLVNSMDDIDVAVTVMNDTTTISTLSFSSLRTSHAGPYTCQGTLASPAAKNDIISISSSPIPVNVTLPAPSVSLSVPSGTLYQGTSVTLTCMATLPFAVDTPVNVSFHWTPDDRFSITPPSTAQSPFISTLTIKPLESTGNFSCRASANSPSSDYIISSERGDPDEDTVSVTPLPTPNVSISFSEDATPGESFNMTCVAGVVPGLVVQPNMMVVFPNKTAVSEVGSSVLEYKFSQLRTSDAGDYTCTATVDIPEAGINSITGSTVGNITVKIPQPVVNFSGTPVDLSAPLYSGTVFNLMCNVYLGPSVDTPLTLLTEWRKNGDTISDMDNGRISADSVAVGASAGYKSALTFSPLSNTQLGGDDGEYTCSVRVKDQEFIIGNVASGVQTITVKDLEPPMVQVEFVGSPTTGETFSLECVVTTEEGVRPENISITWTIPGGQMKVAESKSTSGGVTTGRLSFVPLNTSHGGEYVCTGRIQSPDVAVNVSNNSSREINVTIPAPSVSLTTSAGGDGPFYEGTQLNITCQVSVNAAVDTGFTVDISWKKGEENITISDTAGSGHEFTGTLTLSPLTPGDSAQYECTARVPPTEGDRVLPSNATTTAINITVEQPKAPTVTGGSVIREAGESFSIDCNFKAPRNLVDPPSVVWLKGTQVSSNKTLSFPLLKTSQGGNYICRVSISIESLNLTLSGSDTTALIVKIPPPSFSLSQSHTPYNGTKFSIICTVTVNSTVDTPITINSTWLLSPEVNNPTSNSSSSDEKDKLKKSTSLVFRPVRGQDSGTYICSADVQPQTKFEFIIGVSANKTTSIVVQGLPRPKVDLTITSSAGSGSEQCLGVDFSQQTNTISCLAGVTSNLQGNHTVTLMGDGEELRISMRGENITQELQPASSYEDFTCRVCINIEEAGIEDYCSSRDLVVIGRVPPIITSNMIDKSSDKVTIDWANSAGSIETFSVLRYILDVRVYVSAGPGKERTESLPDYPLELPETPLQTTVGSLEKETPYEYTLVAGNSRGCGPHSTSSVFFTEEGDPGVPPHNVKVERIDGTTMRVSFGRLSYVEAKRTEIFYFISYAPSGGARKRQGGGTEGPVEGNQTTIAGLDPNTAYDVTVFTATDRDGSDRGTESESQIALSPETSGPSGSPVAGIIGGIIAALLVAIAIVAVILLILYIKRARDRESFGLFSKNKRDLYATPSAGNEMVTLRSTSPHESDEARKKEMEASNEIESFSPTPVPQTVVADRMKPISVDSFRDHVNKMHEERDKGFEAEYQSLGSEPLASHEVAKRQHNRAKNRFANIFPYDESRVKMDEISGEEGSDYINACWMDGYNRSNVYIAAQGPMPNTIADFWRMIWQFKIEHIVMLTKCLEAGRRKCEQYWADNIGDVFETQDKKMEITTTSSMTFADFEIRTFNAKNTLEPDEKPLAVTQYHFTSWPDHGVPKFATSIISFIRRVQKAHNKESGVPLLVHCSAGVGRTGTFILLDSMLERIKIEKTVNVYEFLCGLRRRRVLMVQTLPQYVFIHDALCELITCGETDVAAPALKVKIQRLSKVIPGKGVTGFQEQFQLLDQVSRKPEEDDCNDAREHFNRSKNRYADRLPYNMSRARLRPTGEDGSEYINASFIDGYKKRNAYIATQGPLANTVGDFWRLMWEFKSKVMVMLCSLSEDGHEACHPFWPYDEGSTAKYGKITVTLQSETSYDNFIQRKMLIQDDKAVQMGPTEGVVVTQFQLSDWPEHGRPASTGAVVEMLEMITKAQMNTGNRAITVICNDGVGRTGTFICLHSQLERLKTEGVVDFFQAVKSARIQRACLVPDADQYAYCHEVLADFVHSYDNYANFKDVV